MAAGVKSVVTGKASSNRLTEEVVAIEQCPGMNRTAQKYSATVRSSSSILAGKPRVTSNLKVLEVTSL